MRARSAGLSANDLAFLFAASNLVYALMAVPIGALSDRVGRRPLLFLAWAVCVGLNVGFSFAESAPALVALFLAYGIFYAAK